MDAVFAVCGWYIEPGTESWLDPSIKDGDIFPEEFKGNVYRKDRKSDHHGGVFVAIKNTFDSEEAEDLRCSWAVRGMYVATVVQGTE
jgi:hypothetical protein